MWLTLALFSAIFLGLNEVTKKQALNGNAVIPVLAASVLLGALLMVVPQVLSLVVPQQMQQTHFYIPTIPLRDQWAILLKAIVVLGSWIFGFFATKHLPLTLSSPIKATRPVFVVLGAVLLMGEQLSALRWLGVGVVLAALVGLSLIDRHDEGQNREASQGKMLWIYFLIISTLLGAASGLWDKWLIARYDRMSILAYTYYYQSLMMLVVVWWLWYPQRQHSTPYHWRGSIFWTALLLTAADYLYFYALSQPDALLSIVSTIRRSGVVITFVVGAILFRERNIWGKAAILTVVLAGVLLLYFG